MLSLRSDLAAGELATFVINSSDGRIVKVPSYLWNTRAAGGVLWRDKEACFEAEGDKVVGSVVVLEGEFDKYLIRERL